MTDQYVYLVAIPSRSNDCERGYLVGYGDYRRQLAVYRVHDFTEKSMLYVNQQKKVADSRGTFFYKMSRPLGT